MRPSTLLGLPATSWEAYQLDLAAHSLADRIDAAVNDESRRAARRKHDDGGSSITRAVMRVLHPADPARPSRQSEPGARRVLHDLTPDGEVTWRYEDEPPPAGSTPLDKATV